VQDVELNRKHLPDLKVDGILIFKRMSNPKKDEKLEFRMEAVDPAKPDAHFARACSFGPQGWPWWDDEDLGDPATPVLLARNTSGVAKFARSP